MCAGDQASCNPTQPYLITVPIFQQQVLPFVRSSATLSSWHARTPARTPTSHSHLQAHTGRPLVMASVAQLAALNASLVEMKAR